ncbi:MAG: hypothetical protein JWP12_1357 [Bacteroidetes bacterium]|nr:hypothetical protein [Bacteroidota bacterium]
MIKKIVRFACFFFLLFPGRASAQFITLNEGVVPAGDRTYISFSQGLGNMRTPARIRPLNAIIFEGQLAPSFFVRLGNHSPFGVAFTPKVVLRMYQQASLPVKSPSYNPSLMIYQRLNYSFFHLKMFKWFKTEKRVNFLTYKIAHLSNGQAGSYYTDSSNTAVNLNNGNFSTNYAEIAYSWSAIDSGKVGRAYVNGRIAYEHHFNLDREIGLKNTYYFNKVSIENKLIYSNQFKASITYSIMTGSKQFGVKHSVDLFLSYRLFPKNSDFSVFIRGYVGPDYYNIYYVNNIRAVTVGILADPLSIPIFKK